MTVTVTVAHGDDSYAPFLAGNEGYKGPGGSLQSGSSVALSISSKAFAKSQLWTNGLVPGSIALMRAASMLRPGNKSPVPGAAKSCMAATGGSQRISLSKLDSVVFAQNSGMKLTGVQHFLQKAGSMHHGPSIRMPRGPSGRMLFPQIGRNRVQLKFINDVQVCGA